MNYNMHDLGRPLPDLHNMLSMTQQELFKNKSTICKDKKGKGKRKSAAKPTSKDLKPKGAIEKKPKVTVQKDG